jgi:hypothetical protein
VSSKDALPVCRGEANLNRLVSLWDIVNQFDLGNFLNAHGKLMAFVLMLDGEKAKRGAGACLEDERFSFLLEVFAEAKEFCDAAGFESASRKTERTLRNHKTASSLDLSGLQVEIMNVCEAMASDARRYQFLRVAYDRADYIDSPDLFGGKVADSFPSAIRDMTEAGNCLAAENNTGAVFHLMRAAEVALRALAADRGVAYPDAALSSKQVGDLLSALDGKMADLRKADAKLWPTKDIKDAQIRFYHMALAEFRDFNEVWRKYMAHAHEGAFYDRFQAFSIFNHVKLCMVTLAEKISENVATLLYWTTT